MGIAYIKKIGLAALIFAWGGDLVATTRYVAEPQREAVRQWAQLEAQVQNGEVDRKLARADFKKLWPAVVKDEVRSPRKGLWQWVFPLPGHGEEDFTGDSYNAEGYHFYDGPLAKGHPALKIFVRDRRRRGVDDRTGKPAPVVSATEGVVVGEQKFWQVGDKNILGNYVCVLDLESKRFFYYAHLGTLAVSPGQLVSKGEVLGSVGRSGPKIHRDRLGTHLRFEVHSFDEGLFYPVYPGRKLRDAKHLEFPLKEPDYSRPLKKTK